MTQFITAITSMQTESCFARRYDEGISKTDYWDATYEGHHEPHRPPAPDCSLHLPEDLSRQQSTSPGYLSGLGRQLRAHAGYRKTDFKNLMRLYLTIHADHEGGNASAHTTHW